MEEKLKTGIAARMRGLPKERLDEFIELVDKLVKLGIQPGDCFPEGTIAPDTSVLRTIVDRAALQHLIDVSVDDPRITRMDYFPIGIIRNDLFDVRISSK